MLTLNGSGADKADVHQFFRRSLADVIRNRRRPDGRAPDDGFSLIELMVALFVFALLASGFAATMGATLKAFQRSRVKTLSEQIATDQLENARRMSYDDLGNVAGNPLGLIPLTKTQPVGGYSFTVTTRVSFVDDHVALTIATGADYKMVVVTVVAVGLGAPATTMSTLIAPPAKPPADRGRVSVTVNDFVINSFVPNVGVDLVKGTSIVPQREISNAEGVASFPSLTPSPNLGPVPAPGPNDYYYVNRGTAPSPSLPAGYYLLPDSNSALAGSLNKFTVPAATNVPKLLNIYRAAMVNLQLTDQAGGLWQDAASVRVTAAPVLGTLILQPTPLDFNIAAGVAVAPFNEVPLGTGIVPKNAYLYTFTITGPDGCNLTLNPANLYDSATYLTDASFNLPGVMPCVYATLKLHATDSYDGSNLAGATITVNQGPVAGFTRDVVTDALGNASLRVRAGATKYKATISTVAGRAAVSVMNISVPDATAVGPIDIQVPAPTKLITVSVTDGFTKAALPGVIVKTTGGPAGASVPNCTTNASGICVLTVPTGAASPGYTIAVLSDAAGRLGVVSPTPVPSTIGDSAISLEDPWAAMMTVNVHVTDAVTGANLGPSSVRLTGGPPNALVTPLTTYTTDANGDVVGGISVPVGTGANYTLTVPALAPRNQGSVAFGPTALPPATLQLAVPRPMATLTVKVVTNVGSVAIPNKTVQISGGPSGVTATMLVSTPSTTDVNGRVTFSVPVGAAPYVVTVGGSTVVSTSPAAVVPAGGLLVTVKVTTP